MVSNRPFKLDERFQKKNVVSQKPDLLNRAIIQSREIKVLKIIEGVVLGI